MGNTFRIHADCRDYPRHSLVCRQLLHQASRLQGLGERVVRLKIVGDSFSWVLEQTLASSCGPKGSPPHVRYASFLWQRYHSDMDIGMTQSGVVVQEENSRQM
jgi:hypothetical protein